MTILEAIARIKAPLSAGISADDERISDRYLYSELKTTRAKVLHQRLNSYHSLSQNNYTTIDCMPLELGQYSDCPCYTTDCYILRSKYPLPRIITYKDGLAIEGVYTLDGREITLMQQKKSQFRRFRRTGHDDLFYFIHNNYVYVLGSTTLKVISITAAFADPMELSSISACGNGDDPSACFDLTTSDFPIDDDLFDSVEKIILQKHLQVDERMPNDTENNARDTEQTNERE